MVNIYSTRLYARYRKISEKEILLKEIEQTKQEMRKAYFDLSRATDSRLIESIVYRLKSLEIRYGYLLEKIKEQPQ